jgi:hypothetical protein
VRRPRCARLITPDESQGPRARSTGTQRCIARDEGTWLSTGFWQRQIDVHAQLVPDACGKPRFEMCPIFGTASRATCVDVGGRAMLEQQLSHGDQSGTMATLAIAADQHRVSAP